MSVEFSNAYQEILLDNLTAIIKQNFVFQTQLKLSENVGKQKEESENKFLELQKQFNELNNLYNEAKNELGQIDVYKSKAEQNNSAHEEKSRIQTALNDEMKKSSALQNELQSKESEILNLKNTNQQVVDGLHLQINELNDYIKKLEEIVPVTKLKKLGSVKTIPEVKEEPVFEEKNDTPKIENKLQKVLDGSAF
jgi:chromosome segregation ATPase